MPIPHEPLEMVAGNQFVMHDRPRKVRIIASQTHQLVRVLHVVGWIRNKDRVTAKEIGTHSLTFRRHHSHPPRFFTQLRHRHQIAFFDEVNGFVRHVANEPGLFTGFDELAFDEILSRTPIVFKSKLFRCLEHFFFAPLELTIGDFDQFSRRIGNVFELERFEQCFVADRLANDFRFVTAVDSGQLAFEQRCIFTENRVCFLIGCFAPPREHRIVSVVEPIPFAKRTLQLIDSSRCANGISLVDRRSRAFIDPGFQRSNFSRQLLKRLR